ncbi:MAG: AMP-binding protein, partial [Acidimicrobiia bacterium]
MAAASGFFAVAERFPDRHALVDPDERVHTYGELATRANRLARGLRARGIGDGDTVAIMMRNSAELLELFAATVQIGVCLVLL